MSSRNQKTTRISRLQSEGDLNITEERKSWNQRAVSDETAMWLERDSQVFLHQSLSTPCLDVIGSSENAQIQNLQKEAYLDFHGNSVHQVGYGHPKVVDAVQRQLQKLPFCPRRFTNQAAVKLAEKLVELSASQLTRVLFSPGGTSAIGMALKIARKVTGRFKTISMWDSFHGASLDAISIGGEAIFRQDAGPLLAGTEHVPPPNPTHCPFRCGSTCNLQCADYVEYVLEKEGDVAAVVSETVSSVPCFPPLDYWKRIRAACDRHGALLILDEIPHSLGRTGRMFTYEHYETIPDILVLGKGLGGGVVPLAAVLCKEEFNITGDRALGHYTHEKSSVACAAGLATLEVLIDENLVARAESLGNQALTTLQDKLGASDCVREVRGLGLLLGIELEDDALKANQLAEKVMYGCLKAGISFKVSMGSVLTLAPALTISEFDLERSLQVICSMIQNQAELESTG